MNFFILASLSASLLNSFNHKTDPPPNFFSFPVAVSDFFIPGSITNPAYLPMARQTYFNFSTVLPYDQSSPKTNFKVGYSFKKIAGQNSWQRFKINSYKEDLFKTDLGFLLFKSFSLGGSFNYYRFSCQIPVSSFTENIFDLDLSLLWQPQEWIEVSLWQNNLLSLFKGKNKTFLFPEKSLGMGLNPLKGIKICWNITETEFEYLNSLALFVNLLPNISLGSGYCLETNTPSVSFSWIYNRISLSYNLKHRPCLGEIHHVGLSIFLDEVTLPTVSYGKLDPGLDQKIDINRASLEKLLKIPDLKKIYAKRIIKYRQKYGPLTHKALLQIGLEEKEVKDLIPYIYGLLEEKKKH